MKNYKYQSGEYSIMDKVLTPFWNKAVEFLPMWMAPNLVTLIGFSVLVISTLSFLPYDLTLTQPFNPFLYIMSSISVFIYQTLDAIDGKQARRTGTSSPLGQLFDHGCDAWSTILTIFIPIQVLKMGASTPFFIYFLGLTTAFYAANWEEYHTHVLRSNYSGFGLTECQLFLIGILMVQGLTNGEFSEITMRRVGMMILPSINEGHV